MGSAGKDFLGIFLFFIKIKKNDFSPLTLESPQNKSKITA